MEFNKNRVIKKRAIKKPVNKKPDTTGSKRQAMNPNTVEVTVFQNNNANDVDAVRLMHVSEGEETGFEEDVWYVIQQKFEQSTVGQKMVVVLVQDTQTRKPIGFVMASLMEVHDTTIVFTIDNLIVATEYKRQGFGKAMVEYVHQMVATMRNELLPSARALFVIRNSPWSAPFWKHMEYKSMDTISDVETMRFFGRMNTLEPWQLWKEV